jgi:hypothetical protein
MGYSLDQSARSRTVARDHEAIPVAGGSPFTVS